MLLNFKIIVLTKTVANGDNGGDGGGGGDGGDGGGDGGGSH